MEKKFVRTIGKMLKELKSNWRRRNIIEIVVLVGLYVLNFYGPWRVFAVSHLKTNAGIVHLAIFLALLFSVGYDFKKRNRPKSLETKNIGTITFMISGYVSAMLTMVIVVSICDTLAFYFPSWIVKQTARTIISFYSLFASWQIFDTYMLWSLTGMLPLFKDRTVKQKRWLYIGFFVFLYVVIQTLGYATPGKWQLVISLNAFVLAILGEKSFAFITSASNHLSYISVKLTDKGKSVLSLSRTLVICMTSLACVSEYLTDTKLFKWIFGKMMKLSHTATENHSFYRGFSTFFIMMILATILILIIFRAAKKYHKSFVRHGVISVVSKQNQEIKK